MFYQKGVTMHIVKSDIDNGTHFINLQGENISSVFLGQKTGAITSLKIDLARKVFENIDKKTEKLHACGISLPFCQIEKYGDFILIFNNKDKLNKPEKSHIKPFGTFNVKRMGMLDFDQKSHLDPEVLFNKSIPTDLRKFMAVSGDLSFGVDREGFIHSKSSNSNTYIKGVGPFKTQLQLEIFDMYGNGKENISKHILNSNFIALMEYGQKNYQTHVFDHSR